MHETPAPVPPHSPAPPVEEPRQRTYWQIFLRGLAITLPSILTLVILLWLGRVVYDSIIYPVSTLVRWTAARAVDGSIPTTGLVRGNKLPPLEGVDRRYLVTPRMQAEWEERQTAAVAAGELPPESPIPASWVLSAAEAAQPALVFVPLGNRAVPYRDYFPVWQELDQETPATATGVYMELVTLRYLGSTFVLSTLAVLLALLAIYFVGRLVTIRLGAFLVHKVETNILGRLPIISKVYGSVKQVTDFIFTERTIEYNRVVAIEYPRRGIWSVGFVTGDGLRQVSAAAGEPLINVLVPTSPAPVTGYTMSVPRSQVIDLELSIDQAFQFIISCGVLVPPHQRSSLKSRPETAGDPEPVLPTLPARLPSGHAAPLSAPSLP